MARKCSVCGREIPSDALYCPYCGARVQPEPLTESLTSARRGRIVVRTHPVIHLISAITGIVAILVFVLAASQMFSGTPFSTSFTWIFAPFIALFIAIVLLNLVLGLKGKGLPRMEIDLED